MLWRLPQATSALHLEVLQMIDREALYGRGIGYVDAHLLAAARLTAGSKLWTRDRRLQGWRTNWVWPRRRRTDPAQAARRRD